MKIFIAAIAFAVTISGLVLFNNFKTPAKNQDYAQIVDALKNQSSPVSTVSPKPSDKPSKKSKVLALSSKTPTPNTTLVKIPVSTPTPTPSARSGPSATNSPSNSPVKIIARATASPTPTHTPTPSPSATPITTPSSTPTPSSVASLSPAPSPSATPTSTPTPSITETPTPSVTPSPETSNQPSDYSITALVLTSPIARGNTAELKIQTASSATCSIKFTLPSSSVSSAQGLQSKTADTSGIIDWQWKISGSTKPSPPDAKIDLNCSKDGTVYSGYLQMTITQ